MHFETDTLCWIVIVLMIMVFVRAWIRQQESSSAPSKPVEGFVASPAPAPAPAARPLREESYWLFA